MTLTHSYFLSQIVANSVTPVLASATVPAQISLITYPG